MRFGLKMLVVIVPCILTAVTAANAFPSWMGVYGSHQRQNGLNPGTFAVLMNQDYPALRAEVVIRVGQGTWTTYAMSYAGKVDINSIWVFSPPVAFPAGATVSYYFHGFDGSSSNIYDSANAANYSFIPAPPPAFQWVGNVSNNPANGNIEPSSDISVHLQTWPMGSAASGSVFFTTNNWQQVQGMPLTMNGTIGNDTAWKATLGKFAAGSRIQYSAVLHGYDGTTRPANNGGSNFLAVVNGGRAVTWVGNSRNWPTNGALTSADGLWLDTETYPTSAAVSVKVEFSIDGAEWFTDDLERWAQGINDLWHLSVGTLSPGKKLYYRMVVTDGLGSVRFDPTNGFLVARVAGSATDSDVDDMPDDWERYWFTNLSSSASGNADNDGIPGVPFANALEQAMGTEPVYSNIAAGIATVWTPAVPVQGGVVKILYSPAPNGPLTNRPVRLQKGENGWTVAAQTFGPLASNAASRRFEAVVPVSGVATQIDLTYHDGGAVKDNNRGLDWHIRVRPLRANEFPDADQDGMSDGWELTYFFDPFSIADALLDFDGDSIANLYEYRRNTDPRSATSTNTTLYVDNVRVVNDALDGSSPVVAGGRGPKGTLQGALGATISGDRIQLEGTGQAYSGGTLQPGAKDVRIVPNGEVVIR